MSRQSKTADVATADPENTFALRSCIDEAIGQTDSWPTPGGLGEHLDDFRTHTLRVE